MSVVPNRQPFNGQAGKPLAASPLAVLRHRLSTLKWLLPAALVVLVVAFELGPSRWVHLRYGTTAHYVADILFFGTVGPALAFVTIELLGRWLAERETSELQALALERARRQAAHGRDLSDRALQTLFAASLLLDSMEAQVAELPTGVSTQLGEADHALDQAIQSLRTHLLAHQAPVDSPDRPHPGHN